MDKSEILRKAKKHLSSDRVITFGKVGIDLVLGKREMYKIVDIDGKELWDCHLNGGTYSFGHRNSQLLQTLKTSLMQADVGNHHFPSAPRVDLAEMLSEYCPGTMIYSVFTPSGAESVDVAIKSARWATQKRKVVSIDKAYHGRTGLSGAAGDDSSAKFFLSDYPDEFLTVPFNDISAMESLLRNGDIACVLMETIPATYGFPTPSQNYLQNVKELCIRYGAAYIADEVQTGLGRTGTLWGVEHFNVEPDILITGKALSAGLYPISACVMSEKYGAWQKTNGWGYVSTFGGAEPGCAIGIEVLKLATSSLPNVNLLAKVFATKFESLVQKFEVLRDVRQTGVVIGIECKGEGTAVKLMAELYQQGIWAIFAGFDTSVLQFKPGLLLTLEDVSDIMGKFEKALYSLSKSIQEVN
ncbi:aspartate aminotransferase family protein [Ningiella sp. W23]|uniref:class-III pyridoxal-phosphate-dependent aminotransferase n=1 Tax=Ningiella sp. W23 TaxID=3023715 RepID=UPI003757F732